jgi:acyl-[acyl-carrier-protein]-phospholipid O-acyltransferase / long-chain-fatty-acid--[acyl-carrier-protein] ligase
MGICCIPDLFTVRRFLPLFITQFLGAFNDNLFKNALVILITYEASTQPGMNAQVLITLAAGLFMLPYFLFSASAGQVADKYDRSRIARYTKISEIILMILAAVGFITHSPLFLIGVLFCMGAQSTFFGPIKYALLPQHLKENELLAGNSYIQAGTFLAILTGTITGGLLILQPQGREIVSAMAIGCAVIGYISSRYIPPAKPASPELRFNWNAVQESWRMINNDMANTRVWRCIMAISWFWLVGATFLSQFPTFGKQILHTDETVVTLFLVAFSVGIGVGALLCNRLLKGEVKSTYVPFGILGISIFTIDLYFASQSAVLPVDGQVGIAGFLQHPENWRIMFDLFATAISGGLYVVPLQAIIQHDSKPESRARTIASNNIMNAFFMVMAAILTIAMLKASFSVSEVFLAMAIANAPVALYVLRITRKANRQP